MKKQLLLILFTAVFVACTCLTGNAEESADFLEQNQIPDDSAFDTLEVSGGAAAFDNSPDDNEVQDGQSIRSFFTWIPGNNDKMSAEGIEKNRQYAALMARYAKSDDLTYTYENLIFDIGETFAVDGLTVVYWHVQNAGNENLYIVCREWDAQFAGRDYDLCGGHNWQFYILKPGQGLDARFSGNLIDRDVTGDGLFTLTMSIYKINESQIPENAEPGYTYIEQETLNDPEIYTLEVPMTMISGNHVSALNHDEPLEYTFPDYRLVITRAERSDADLILEFQRIYESEKEAYANSPADLYSYWTYPMREEWISVSFGDIPDEPVELPDGSWAWEMSTRIYRMVYLPDTVNLVPSFVTQQGTSEKSEERVVLHFNGE